MLASMSRPKGWWRHGGATPLEKSSGAKPINVLDMEIGDVMTSHDMLPAAGVSDNKGTSYVM